MRAACRRGKKGPKSRRHHKTQLAISEAETSWACRRSWRYDSRISRHESAENLIAEALALLRREAFDDAVNLATQAEKLAQNARRASVKATDAATTEKTKAFTAAKLSIAAAQTQIDRAESVYASVHAEDIFQRAASALEQADISVKAEPYAGFEKRNSGTLARQRMKLPVIDRHGGARGAGGQIAPAKMRSSKRKRALTANARLASHVFPSCLNEPMTIGQRREDAVDEHYGSAITASPSESGGSCDRAATRKVEVAENPLSGPGQSPVQRLKKATMDPNQFSGNPIWHRKAKRITEF